MPRTRVEQEPLASWRATVDSAAREPAAMKVRHQRNQSRWAPGAWWTLPEAGHERAEERMDGVDAVDGALRAVLGIIGFMRGDLQVVQHVDVCGRLVRGDDRARADAVAKGLRRALARDNAAARDLEEGGVRVLALL